MGQYAHFLCTRDRVQSPLTLNYHISDNTDQLWHWCRVYTMVFHQPSQVNGS